MRSHTYAFRLKDLVGFFTNVLVAILLFAVLVRLGGSCGLLPSPWPGLDVDRTILTHQLEASQKPTGADLVFVGDSSCLMDISGDKLAEIVAGTHRPLNLGTLMYVGFDGYAAILSRYAHANPGGLSMVLVLVHPELLRSAPAASYLAFMSDFYSGTDSMEALTIARRLRGLLGLNLLEDRLLSRSPRPLPGEYGRYYGFNLDLDHFMDQHQGSAVDPHHYIPGPGHGNAEYRFNPALESRCLALKAVVPPEAKLILGLTPIPESFASPGYPARWETVFNECAKALKPDLVLTNLPAIMPDSDFASTTHLNAQGSLKYTEILARCLNLNRAP